ncbi:MAG: RtcB family protein [Armatimonadetes bacterium]|nr:RtcB family protein [Armatimonadota bacterium]
MDRSQLRHHGDYRYEIAANARPGMAVPAVVFADEALLEPMLSGATLTQLTNVATLPGVYRFVCGMPDMHEGYGFPVGGVAATRMPDGVVSPGGVGFDINCGVRLLSTPIEIATIGARAENLVQTTAETIAAGTGKKGTLHLDDSELDRVLALGSGFAVKDRGLGYEADIEHTESRGALPNADPGHVSKRARERGADQLGTMGSGNHFIEYQWVEEVYDAQAAAAMNLAQGCVAVLIHSGSRGLGHQVCTDYVRRLDQALASYGMSLPDRQLSCAPANSPDGRAYLAAMACAANYAWANRQAMGHQVRKILAKLFKVQASQVKVVYDVAHNIAKIEDHDGVRLCVHRKGATRAFAAGHPELPEDYRDIGQPVFIPGSMGTRSYVLAAEAAAMRLSFGSTCHGAGRSHSRTAVKQMVTGSAVRKQLEEQGIAVRCPSNQGLAEEAPEAYKDVDRVVDVVVGAGLARRVARLRPFGVIKG